MKVVALISGGKDSCYNMMQCVNEGHEIIALANLRPNQKDELDSYMFQTVGHHAIDLYAEAMGLPLYRRTIEGSSVAQGRDYEETADDEVEDLYQLLKQIQTELDIEAVSVGAILSDYQRVRVEHVCIRLGLIPLAFLWRRNQHELLKEMIDCKVEAIIIKVAALGLTPDKHLGRTLSEIHPHMIKMHELYGLNVCGEGGEYETFTLDCPLFNKKLIIDQSETVLHSDDAFAPVGYLNLKEMHTQDKDNDTSLSHKERLKGLPMYTGDSLMSRLFLSESCQSPIKIKNSSTQSSRQRSPPAETYVSLTVNDVSGLVWMSGVEFRSDGKYNADLEDGTRKILDRVKGLLEERDLNLTNLVRVCLYVQDMSQYPVINTIYKQYFNLNPPCRICVETCLPADVVLRMSCIAYKDSPEITVPRNTMHVQSLSHWAPANIGPYSQAVMLGSVCYVAGMIALYPSTLRLISGGIIPQCRLSLHHVTSVLQAMGSSLGLRNVVSVVCYITQSDHIRIAQEEWKNSMKQVCVDGEAPQFVNYLVVSGLPRGALVEWQVVAHTQLHHWKVERSVSTKDNVKIEASVTHQSEETSFTCIQATADAESSACLSAAAVVDQLLTACMTCLQRLDCDWTGISLCYSAEQYTEPQLYTAYRDFFKERAVNEIPAFTLIPVIELETSKRILTMYTS